MPSASALVRNRTLKIMPSYQCKYMTPQGIYEKKSFEADSRSDLKWRLEREGYFVYRIQRQGSLAIPLPRDLFRKRFKLRDFFAFNKELAVLIRTGLPIVAALDATIEENDQSELQRILRQVRYDVSTGQSLSEAFGKYPRHFSPLYISALQAGEKSGNIPEALHKHIGYLQKSMALRRKFISASIYPLILTAASIAVLLLLVTYVVPSFTQTYLESGTSLPAITAGLIAFSRMVQSHIFFIAVCALLLAVGFRYAMRQEAIRLHWDRLLLHLPYIGTLYRSYATALFLRTVAMVLSAGATLVDSIRTASGTLSNLFLQDKSAGVVRRITEGMGFSEALSTTNEFPKLAIRMIAAGESGGELEQVLIDAADFYDDEVEVKLAIISATIEPALMILMGLVIGFIVLAMYMPIFQLAGTVT
jgi:type IV pilus assembly protein PilC